MNRPKIVRRDQIEVAVHAKGMDTDTRVTVRVGKDTITASPFNLERAIAAALLGKSATLYRSLVQEVGSHHLQQMGLMSPTVTTGASGASSMWMLRGGGK